MEEYRLKFINDPVNGKHYFSRVRYRMEEFGHAPDILLRNRMVDLVEKKIKETIATKGIAPSSLTFDGQERSDWVIG